MDRGTLYYDDTCSVCTALAERARGMAGVDLRGASQYAESGFSHEALMREIHLVDDSRVYRGADAVTELLARSGRKKLAAFLRIPGIRATTHLAYRFFARHRSLVKYIVK